MTTHSAMNQVGAISRVADWHSTDWQKVNQNVRRLQARIARGNTGIVKPRSARSVNKA